MFIDSDDLVEGDFFADQIDLMKRKAADICFSRCIKRWAEGTEVVSYEPSFETNANVIYRWLLGRSGPGTCSVLWRTEALKNIGAWDESLLMNQDGELIIRAMSSKLSLIHNTKGSGVYIQMGGSSVSKARSHSALKSLIHAGMKIEKSVRNSGLLSKTDIAVAIPAFWNNLNGKLASRSEKSSQKLKTPELKLVDRIFSGVILFFRGEIKVGLSVLFGSKSISRFRNIKKNIHL